MTHSSEVAFSRNVGLISAAEQARLSRACVAVPGVGGVGGWHALTLARQGVGRFHLADFDTFSAANINRQAGAFVSTLGRPKVDVLREMILDINPAAHVTMFSEGVQPSNVDRFLGDADVVLDGIDFFALDARRLVFERARRGGIWALTAGPLGFGAAVLAFAPDQGMTFDEYFDFESCNSAADAAVAFAVGLAPRGLHTRYMDLTKVDLGERRGPSAALACQLCGSVLAMETLGLLLGWSTPEPAPRFLQLDLRRRTWARGRLRWGNRGPLQQVKRTMLRRHLLSKGVTLEPLEASGARGPVSSVSEVGSSS
jgi:molybdopterin/thiamine biosynthesis adenylyltransferase